MRLGTSSLVVAAFIGPGTVLTCARAGVESGYQLAWVLLFATVAVFVLQSFTAGTGILARKGLGQALREAAPQPNRRVIVATFVVLGLWIGCASFEAGNLAGASAGLAAVMGVEEGSRWILVVLTGLAGILLLFKIESLIKVLAGLVGLMSILFIASALMLPIEWSTLLKGLVVPQLPAGSIVTAVALIGTTIVTYNLFLHPSAARKYWKDEPEKKAWRTELIGMALFIPLGGLISLAILVAAASLQLDSSSGLSAGDFAGLLEPVAGPMARVLFGVGLLAAGLTSTITAPLAAAAGTRELFAWDEGGTKEKLVWISVLVVGFLFNLTGLSPLNVIIAAQAANGLLLPAIAAFVLYLTARQEAVTLPRWYLGLGVVITLICAGLGVRTLNWVWTNLVG